jgi:L-amino acid N-acyltransferase YncA
MAEEFCAPSRISEGTRPHQTSQSGFNIELPPREPHWALRSGYRGMRRLVGRVARRLLRPVATFELSVVYRLDLARPVRPFSARIATEIRFASASDLPHIRDLNPNHSDDFLLARFAAGHLCFIAWCNDTAVGQNWLALSPVQDDDYYAAIADDEVYCLDAFTRPEFRGKAIHTELLCRMLMHAQKIGRRVAFTRTSAMNSDSWKTHLRLGWSEAGSTFFVRMRGRQKALLKGPSIYPLQLR